MAEESTAAARSSFGRRRKATLTDDDPSSDDSTRDDDGWSPSEDAALKKSVEQHGRNFKKIAKELGTTRTEAQLEARMAKVGVLRVSSQAWCPVEMSRLQVSRPGNVKGPWQKHEDDIILRCLEEGVTKWSDIADRVTGRIGKQCRERFFNHLDRKSEMLSAYVDPPGCLRVFNVFPDSRHQ